MNGIDPDVESRRRFIEFMKWLKTFEEKVDCVYGIVHSPSNVAGVVMVYGGTANWYVPGDGVDIVDLLQAVKGLFDAYNIPNVQPEYLRQLGEVIDGLVKQKQSIKKV